MMLERADSIFSTLNGVIVGYIFLIFLPRWHLTPNITLALAAAYSCLYMILVVEKIHSDPVYISNINLGSLNGIVRLFNDPHVVLAGWTHYIAFDLMIARFITMDAQIHKIPHLLVIPLLITTLMAGPIGLFAYLVLRTFKDAKITVINLLYGITTMLCLFMSVWIFVTPASYLLGFESTRDKHMNHLQQLWAKPLPPPTPFHTLGKYDGESIVLLTHVLPAGTWASLAPLQLLSGPRQRWPYIHRALGYIFALCSALVSLGLLFIHLHGLSFLQEDTLIASRIGISHIPSLLVVSGVLSLFFFFSMVRAVQLARQKRFCEHRAWIIRHLGSGIWVALQRIYLMLVNAQSPVAQRAAFSDGAVLSVLLTMTVAEVLARQLEGGKDKIHDD
jgi:hypothetical protein